MCAALLAGRAFLGNVYALASGSMRPTLFGGVDAGGEEPQERVLVLYDRAPSIERFDLLVAKAGDGGAPLVKRAVGLPGESIAIVDGDLRIEGRALPREAARPEPILMFDLESGTFTEVFDLKLAPEGPWSRTDEGWWVDAREVPVGSRAASASLRRGLRDGYLDSEGQLVRGKVPIGDVLLEAELLLAEDAWPAQGQAPSNACVVLSLIEAGDTFELRLTPRADGQLFARLRRFNPKTLSAIEPEDKQPLLAEETVPVPRNEPLFVRFANVDNTVWLEVDGRVVLQASYERNEARVNVGPGTSARGTRVALGAEGLRARFAELRVLRDLHYTSAGGFATDRPLRLALDEVFLLGDNSSASTDSRTFGPIPLSELLGRPVAVVWPPSRWRRLGGAEEARGERPIEGPGKRSEKGLGE